MWVEKLGDGRFKCVERYESPLTGKDHKVSIIIDKNTTQSRKAAAKTLADKIEKKLAALETPDKEYSFAELREEYHTFQKQYKKISTAQRNYGTLKNVGKLLGDDTLVDRLTYAYVDKKFRGSGKEAGTLNEYMSRLKAMLRWGYSHDMVHQIGWLQKVIRYDDIPHKKKIEDKFLESDELAALIDDMDLTEWKLLTKFMALSGLRFTKFCALEKSDVDLKNRSISITKGYDSNNKLVNDNTKNVYSERDVHIQPQLLEVCKEISSLMSRKQMRLNIRSKLFMFDDTGDHIDYFAYNKYLKFHADCVTGKRITPHALRHTHASLLVEQGFALDEIARRLGRGDSKITREIYVHVTKRLKEKDNERLDNLAIF